MSNFRAVAWGALGAATLMLSACALPQTDTFQGGDHGRLIFPDAPAGAELVLDGQAVGPASSYANAGHSLSVSGGAHSVRVSVAGTVLVNRRVYVDNGALVRIEVKP